MSSELSEVVDLHQSLCLRISQKFIKTIGNANMFQNTELRSVKLDCSLKNKNSRLLVTKQNRRHKCYILKRVVLKRTLVKKTKASQVKIYIDTFWKTNEKFEQTVLVHKQRSSKVKTWNVAFWKTQKLVLKRKLAEKHKWQFSKECLLKNTNGSFQKNAC